MMSKNFFAVYIEKHQKISLQREIHVGVKGRPVCDNRKRDGVAKAHSFSTGVHFIMNALLTLLRRLASLDAENMEIQLIHSRCSVKLLPPPPPPR